MRGICELSDVVAGIQTLNPLSVLTTEPFFQSLKLLRLLYVDGVFRNCCGWHPYSGWENEAAKFQ